MSDSMRVVVMVDNDDDKLPGDEWRDFMMHVNAAITVGAVTDGRSGWPTITHSSPSPAGFMQRRTVWSFEITPEAADVVQGRLLELASNYDRVVHWWVVGLARVLTRLPTEPILESS